MEYLILIRKNLKILSFLIGIGYFSLFYYFFQSLSVFNFVSIILCSLSALLFFITLYLIQRTLLNQDKVDELILNKEVIKNRFNECNQTVTSMLTYVTDGIALLNLQLDFFKVNKRFCDILGYTSEKILTWNLDEIVPLTLLSKHQISINQLITGKIENYSFKKKFIKKSTETIWLSIVIALIRDSTKKPHYFVMYIHNLTPQKLAEDHLSYLTLNDPLTKLANRHQFEKYVSQLLKSQNHQKKFCLLLIDIDDFKNVNNTVGYEVGNALLQQIAERINNLIKQATLLARLHSDEFALIITEKVNKEMISELAETLLIEIFKPIYVKKHELFITASIGISFYPDNGFTTRKLMKHADIALHHAKRNDKNNYQFYSISMSRNEKTELKSKNILAHALINDQFFLQYQPRQHTLNQQLTAIEVQISLSKSERRSLSLDEMLLLVQHTGLAMPINDWLLKTTCQQLKKWQETMPNNPKLAIQLSVRQMNHPDFLAKIFRILTEYNLSPSCFALEITGLTLHSFETSHPQSIYQVMMLLQQAGIQLIFHDQASIFLSLNDSKKYFFDKIIINHLLIQQLLTNETAQPVIQAIINKANRMNIETIAECVQEEEQLIRLKEAGCYELQGPLIGCPVSSEAMTDLLQKARFPFLCIS